MKNWKNIVWMVMILVSPSYTKMSLETKKTCNMAQSCYMNIVEKSADKRPYEIRMEKAKCNEIKKECDRLLKIKDKSQSKLEEAYNTYKKAFKRYTSMVTTSPAQDEFTVQKALQEYRDSYARYKAIKDTQGESLPKLPKENTTLDTTAVDGIEDIDSGDVENNIAYIEGLRSRTENKEDKEIQKSNVVDCKSKKFTDTQLAAVEVFQNGDHQKSLDLFQQAYQLCPTDEMTKQMIEDLKKDVKNTD